MSLRKDVGQLLIAGLSGGELTDTERAWWRLLSPGGVILFRRNIQSAEATHALLSELRTLSDGPLLRAVDLEGGLVDRLRNLLAPMAAPAVVARTGSRQLMREHGRLIGRSARLLGFNTTFAPVLDLHTSQSADVLRTRTAGETPRDVVTYAKAFLEGLRKEKVLGCGKHFPGLGGGTLDSHHATPAIERTWTEMWQQDLVPFRELRRALPMIMVAHARYPQASPRRQAALPASISPFWISRVLKRRLGYNGLIVSDDMEMGGILNHCSIEDAAVSAIAAGTHLVEICKDPSLVLRAYEALLREAETSRSFRHIVQNAANKVRRSKRRLLGRDALSAPPTPAEVRSAREAVVAFSAEAHRRAAQRPLDSTPEPGASI